jgi:citrate/tricarballylate utilization protein
MARVRVQTYSDYDWTSAFGKLYKRNGLTLCLAVAAALSLFLILALKMNGTLSIMKDGANFYDVFPHNLLVSLFAPIFAFVVLSLSIGVRSFWRNITPATSGVQASPAAVNEAATDVLRLKYLDGGHGEGCNNEDDAFTLSRRRAHHLTFYGFMLCFAATSVATLYHYAFGWTAPYALTSLPKLLGVVGGISLLLGSAGLFILNLQRNTAHGDLAQKPMDLGFITLLFFTSLSGLVLWLGRETSALPSLLAVHLGVVMALFITLPYGKFAHGIYRTAALIRFAVEKRQPNSLGLGGD